MVILKCLETDNSSSLAGGIEPETCMISSLPNISDVDLEVMQEKVSSNTNKVPC